jgi:hypothetical protein
MVAAYNNRTDKERQKVVSDVYERHFELRKQENRTLHHVETEVALLKIRVESNQKSSIIPFLLNGDHQVNFPAYLIGQNDILRTAIGLKPERDGSKYECFLQVLEKLADRGRYKPGPAHLVQSMREVYDEAVEELKHESLTGLDLKSFLNRHMDKANRVSDAWTDSQRLPSNKNELKG